MTDKKLQKYQVQAAKLGLTNINATHIDVLLLNVVGELKQRPGAGTLELTRDIYVRQPGDITEETTLYEYYSDMIRDTVKQIRQAGGRAYIFSIEQIADVIKYEKNAKFKYIPDGDCFKVTM